MNKRYRRRLYRLFPAWNFVEYALAYLAIGLINCFPIAASTWICRRIGELMFLLLPGRKRIALENLSIAFGRVKSEGERRTIARESFRHLATSFMEFFRFPRALPMLSKQTPIIGTEYLERAFAKGKGAILVMSHLGPWEYLSLLPYTQGYPTTVLVRPVRNAYFYRWITAIREYAKVEYVDKDQGPRKIISELRKNHLVAITIDQWAGNEGLWVDFFARPTSTTSLPGRLAQKTGCALIPACCIRLASGKYEVRVSPEVSLAKAEDNWVEKITRKLNQHLAEQISCFPGQWTWPHKRWKDSG